MTTKTRSLATTQGVDTRADSVRGAMDSVDEGDPNQSDDALWERLQQLPDMSDESPEIQRDHRQFRVAAPAEPLDPQPPLHDPALEPEAWPELPERRRARRRSPWVRGFGWLFGLGLVAFAIFAVWGWVIWSGVDRVDTDGALAASSDGFVNYLIVGTDSRAGLTTDLETADSIGLRVSGERSDTMVVLHVGAEGNHMVSLPRDLWVPIDGGGSAKLNSARASGGVPALIRTIRNSPGIPIHHYLEVDIAGFLSVIEAVGTITIDFDAPACDPKSGLDIRETGQVRLSAEQALAYVRSRTYTEFDAAAATGLDCAEIRRRGLGTTVGNSDFGRTERQRAFLLAVFDRVAAIRNPVTLLRTLGGVTDGLRLDEELGLFGAIDLLRDLRGLDAETHALPVSDYRAPSGASALALNDRSAEVIDLFTGG